MNTHKLFRFILVAFILVGFSVTTNAQSVERQTLALETQTSQMTPEKWQQFSGQVVRALASKHTGLEEGALRMIISYGNKLDVRSARLDLMRIYRSAQNDNLRRMAVVAMGSIQQEWAINYLAQNFTDEPSQSIRQTMLNVVNDYQIAAKASTPDSDVAESSLPAKK